MEAGFSSLIEALRTTVRLYDVLRPVGLSRLLHPTRKSRDKAKCVRRTEERPEPREDAPQRIAAVVRRVWPMSTDPIFYF